MACYLFNLAEGGADAAAAMLRAGEWAVAVGERHRDALDAGDLALVYVAEERVFVAMTELGSRVREDRVEVASVEWWEPPIAIDRVLAAIDPSEKAKSEFDMGVIRITPTEYEAAVSVARST